MAEIKTFFDAMQQMHASKYDRIIKEWGYSSKLLREYLNKYYNEDINYATEYGNIKISYILPYRKSTNGKFNGFYGKMAIDRLNLAIQAKAIIMYAQGDLEEDRLGELGYEALRLYLRVNSCQNGPLMTFKEFNNIVLNAHKLAKTEFDEQYQRLSEICEKLKPKKDQVLYHYTRADFEAIRYEENCKIAYNKWIVEIWPTLLDKYKERKLNEYKKTLRNLSAEQYFELINEYQEKLDKIKINEIKYRRFVSIIKKLKNGEL